MGGWVQGGGKDGSPAWTTTPLSLQALQLNQHEHSALPDQPQTPLQAIGKSLMLRSFVFGFCTASAWTGPQSGAAALTASTASTAGGL
jgi:hypothetical protein